MAQEESCCCLGYVIFIVAYIAMVVGMGSPSWYSMEWIGARIDNGIFFQCYELNVLNVWKDSDCGTIDLADVPDWWQATAGMLIGGVVLGLIAGFTAMYIPVTSTLQVLAGALGLGGAALYIAKVEDLMDAYPTATGFDAEYEWGFFLGIGGAGLLILNGIGLAVMSCCTGCSMRRICCCCSEPQRPGYPPGYGRGPGRYPPPNHYPSAGRTHPPSRQMSQQMSQYPPKYPYGNPPPPQQQYSFRRY